MEKIHTSGHNSHQTRTAQHNIIVRARESTLNGNVKKDSFFDASWRSSYQPNRPKTDTIIHQNFTAHTAQSLSLTNVT